MSIQGTEIDGHFDTRFRKAGRGIVDFDKSFAMMLKRLEVLGLRYLSFGYDQQPPLRLAERPPSIPGKTRQH